tara:strand:- start:135 stop:374 length:240 start_codon:yes stop_codon:yes gene_type:complete
MSNMSYCRFQNTTQDLQDCIDAVEQLINTNGFDEDGDTLSRRESEAMHEMIEQAAYYSQRAEELAEMIEDKKNKENFGS